MKATDRVLVTQPPVNLELRIHVLVLDHRIVVRPDSNLPHTVELAIADEVAGNEAAQRREQRSRERLSGIDGIRFREEGERGLEVRVSEPGHCRSKIRQTAYGHNRASLRSWNLRKQEREVVQ